MLRSIRIGISVGLMTLFLLLFLGGERFSRSLAEPLLFFQFVPSLVKFLLAAAGGMSLGFLLILLLTLLFGRVYCAGLCPLGIMQDISWSSFKKINPKRRFGYQKPRSVIRYGMLGITVIVTVLGSFAVLNLLDPYSLFGRMTAHLLRPVIAVVNNFFVSMLEFFEIYTVSILAVPYTAILVFPVTLGFFLVLLLMSITRGRMYCNTLCPVGTLLGIISHVSRYKITIKQEECISCKRCEKACRSGCINISENHIDSGRCVVCFDCVTLCPTSAIEYNFAGKKARTEKIDPSRRRLLVGSASAAGALILLSSPLGSFPKQLLPQGNSEPTTPPGSLNIDHFAELCTACHLCVNACPSHVIQPAFLEYGLRGIMQPTMNYEQSYCNYECNLCGYICPTGAILPLELPAKQLVQIGEAQLDKDLCIVHTRHEDCGACAEVCPTHAVYTEEKDNIFYPEMNVELCIGCGACEFVCPVNPKAIFVEGNAVHATAKEPFYDQEPVEQTAPQQEEEDFPF